MNASSGSWTDSPAVRRMRARLERRNPRGGRKTADTYERRLKIFFKWLGKGPDEFIEGIEAGGIDPVEAANDFLDHLHLQGLSPSYMSGNVSAIKKLVQVNSSGVFNWKRVELPKLRAVEEDKVPNKEVIRRVLLHADPMERALALVAVSSGMREETMTLLAMEDLDLEAFPDIGVVRVPATKSKNNVKYVTFISPEAREALEAYLNARGRLGSGDPVFATRTGGFYSRPDKLARRWLGPLGRAGLDERSGSWRDYRFHTLKKFFRTALEYAGVSRSFREQMLGHAGDYLDSSYFGPEFDRLVEEYRRAVPELTIEERVGEERVSALEEELAETRRALEALKGAVIGGMKRRLEARGVDTSRTPHEIAAEMGLVEARPVQKVINEKELVGHLSQGWRFVAQLNDGSGKIIVER